MPLDKDNVIRVPAIIPGLSISNASRIMRGKADRYRTSNKITEPVMTIATEYQLYQNLYSIISGSKIITVFQKLRINS